MNGNTITKKQMEALARRFVAGAGGNGPIFVVVENRRAGVRVLVGPRRDTLLKMTRMELIMHAKLRGFDQ